jgi:hypothetical protein
VSTFRTDGRNLRRSIPKMNALSEVFRSGSSALWISEGCVSYPFGNVDGALLAAIHIPQAPLKKCAG